MTFSFGQVKWFSVIFYKPGIMATGTQTTALNVAWSWWYHWNL